MIIMGYFLETEFSITCTNVHEYLKVITKLIVVDFDTESNIKFSYEEKIIKLKVNETKHYMDMLIFLRKYGIMFSEKVIGKRPYPLTEWIEEVNMMKYIKRVNAIQFDGTLKSVFEIVTDMVISDDRINFSNGVLGINGSCGYKTELNEGE